MKKNIKSELISLAHAILQQKDEKNTEELKDLAQKVYEKLTVLSFTEKHFDGPQPSIDFADIEKALQEEDNQEEQNPEDSTSQSLHKDEAEKGKTATEASPESKRAPEEAAEKQIAAASQTEGQPIKKEPETSPDETQEENQTPPETTVTAETPATTNQATPRKKQVKPKKETSQTAKSTKEQEGATLKDIAVHYDDLPQFEPVASNQQSSTQPQEATQEKVAKGTAEAYAQSQQQPEKEVASASRPQEEKTDLFSPAKPKTRNEINPHKKSLNEQLNNGLKFGLNDRLAFINHLFEGSSTDFNRVVSQLNTFENYAEAKGFIENQVKPDYDWQDQEEYEERFYTILEKTLAE